MTDASLDFATLAGAVDRVSDRIVVLAERVGERAEGLVAGLEVRTRRWASAGPSRWRRSPPTTSASSSTG